MTLNEKFDKATDGWIVADKCEEIADDYAIEFADWIITDWTCDERYLEIVDIEQLLKIFKEEKRL